MFDSLPESAGKRQKGRGRFLFSTGAVYVFTLAALAVWAILGTNPLLMGDLTKLAPLPIPVAIAAPAPVHTVQVQQGQPKAFRPPTEVADLKKVVPTELPSYSSRPTIVSTGLPVNSNGWDSTTGVPSAITTNSATQLDPPPPPKAKPTIEPSAPPAPTPKEIKVSGGVLAGSATFKPQPAYPAMAKAARAQGAVNIRVLISEDGRVIEARVVDGNPLLRAAALDAARQWRFSPTKLSDTPVKVEGVLTFNFKLE